MMLKSPVAPYLKLPIKEDALNSVTRGLVGDTSFAVLPDITPRHTFILTILSQLVSTHLIQKKQD
jgi:alpha-1,3-glucosyltransferase